MSKPTHRQTFRDIGDGREEEETGSLPERQQREPPVDGGGRGSLHGETCIKSMCVCELLRGGWWLMVQGEGRM